MPRKSLQQRVVCDSDTYDIVIDGLVKIKAREIPALISRLHILKEYSTIMQEQQYQQSLSEKVKSLAEEK